MMNRLHLVAAAASLPTLFASAAAQGSFVVPPEATRYESLYANGTLLGGGSLAPSLDARTQLLYDTATIPVASATLRSLQLRRMAVSPLGPITTEAVSADIEIVMSMSMRPHDNPSSSFAANNGPNPVTVFQGTVSLPRTPQTTTWPDPWQAEVLFSTPFPYDSQAGVSLVIDVKATNRYPNSFWPIEEYQRDVGQLQLRWNDPLQCRTQANRSPGLVVRPQNIIVGGSYWMRTCCFSNRPSLANNALLFGDRDLALPIPLQSLGIPSGAGCALGIEPALAVPMTLNLMTGSSPATSMTLGPIPIPDDPAFGHLEFVTQHMVFDSGGSQQTPKVYSGPVYWWRVGTDAEIPASYVFKNGDSQASTGAIRASTGISLRFHH